MSVSGWWLSDEIYVSTTVFLDVKLSFTPGFLQDIYFLWCTGALPTTRSVNWAALKTSRITTHQWASGTMLATHHPHGLSGFLSCFCLNKPLFIIEFCVFVSTGIPSTSFPVCCTFTGFLSVCISSLWLMQSLHHADIDKLMPLGNCCGTECRKKTTGTGTTTGNYGFLV